MGRPAPRGSEPAASEADGGGPTAAASAPVGLRELSAVLLRIGATTFGGMWAASRKLEAELVDRRGWLTPEEHRSLMIASTLIPAPKFLSFGGLVGFRLRGWAGAVVALFALLAPGALVVLLGVLLLRPEVAGQAIVPVQRAVGVAIIGLLVGNAIHQIRGAKVGARQRSIGIMLMAAVAATAIAGVSLVLVALAGLAVGAILLKDGESRG